MNRIVLVWIFLLTMSARDILFSTSPRESVTFIPDRSEQDTLMEKQILYSGKIWKNNYHRINGDPYLFSNYFLPGTVSAHSKKFKNLLIRYDIFSDEIMIPLNTEEIVQLNKEMVDSFSITFKNKVYQFSKINSDSLNSIKGFKGYFYVLYKQSTALYIKYEKYISTDITDKSDGDFMQIQKTFLVKDKIAYPVTTVNDLYNALNADKEQIEDT